MSFHVVVGAGGAGIATATQLTDVGARVRLVTRRGTGPDHPGIERIAADATDVDRLSELTEGATALISCAAPPYHKWRTEFPPLAAALLATAERTEVGYVMLSNLYGYGAVAGPMTEDLPLAPNSVKGRVRAAIWNDAITAHQAGRVRVTEVRASSFIGRGAVSVFTIAVAPKVLAGKTALAPADLDAPHSWTSIVDTARALIAVSGDDRSWGQPWHVPTNPPASLRDLATRLAELAGAPTPRLRRMPGWMLSAAGIFSPMIRELPEMQYQFERPFILDSSKMQETFGLAPTPLDDAIRAAIG
jgi:nucleoside-diphosphate-sugar epimerase